MIGRITWHTWLVLETSRLIASRVTEKVLKLIYGRIPGRRAGPISCQFVCPKTTNHIIWRTRKTWATLALTGSNRLGRERKRSSLRNGLKAGLSLCRSVYLVTTGNVIWPTRKIAGTSLSIASTQTARIFLRFG